MTSLPPPPLCFGVDVLPCRCSPCSTLLASIVSYAALGLLSNRPSLLFIVVQSPTPLSIGEVKTTLCISSASFVYSRGHDSSAPARSSDVAFFDAYHVLHLLYIQDAPSKDDINNHRTSLYTKNYMSVQQDLQHLHTQQQPNVKIRVININPAYAPVMLFPIPNGAEGLKSKTV
jgi:hypothetical protein